MSWSNSAWKKWHFMRHPWIWDLKLVHSNCFVRELKCEPHTFSGWWTMEINGTIFPHEAALYGTSISGWCLGSCRGAGKRWWNVGMPRKSSGVESLPSVGCFLCSNLNGRRRIRFYWCMLMQLIGLFTKSWLQRFWACWDSCWICLSYFLMLLRLRLCRHPVSSGGSCRTCGQVMGPRGKGINHFGSFWYSSAASLYGKQVGLHIYIYL